MNSNAIDFKTSPNSGVATLTFDLAGSSVNLLGKKVMSELAFLLDELKNKELQGLIITSAKQDNFIAGADVNEIKELQASNALKAYEASRLGKEVFARLSRLPFRTVAAINGLCLGGGTELALACRYRVAASQAKMGLPEVNLGILPGWGGCVRTVRLAGLKAAVEIVTGAKTLDASKAWKHRLIDEVVEPAQLLKRAEEIALGAEPVRQEFTMPSRLERLALEKNPVGLNVFKRLARKAILAQTKGKYPAPLEALNVMVVAATRGAERACEAESQAFARLAVSDVSKNLVDMFFAQQESKKSVASAGARELTTVGILGSGTVGSGIAQAAAYAGYRVVLHDITDQAVEKGVKTIIGLFNRLVERGRLSRKEADDIVSKIGTTTQFSELADCDLVIEAVPEDLEIKKHVLREMEKSIGKDFIFATNTSSLSVTQMAQAAKKPENFVGIHFFNPVYKLPLVEIVRTKYVADSILATAAKFAQKLGKTTVLVADSPGFIVNRVLAPYLREAAVLLEAGISADDIDEAMKKFGMPLGPITLLDEIGLDIIDRVIVTMHGAFGGRMAPPRLLDIRNELHLLGKKGRRGFYTYGANGEKLGFNPDVSAQLNVKPSFMARGAIQDRLVLLMINEAAMCLQEKILETASQVDLSLVMGTGFPPFLGGALHYADTLGPALVVQKLDLLRRVHGDRYKPCELLAGLATARKGFYINCQAIT